MIDMSSIEHARRYMHDRKMRANVTGDGRATVAELIDKKNGQRSVDPIHKSSSLDELAIQQLRRQGMDGNSAPRAGQEVFVRATSDIHTGGDAVDATDDLSPDAIALVEKACAAIPGLRLAGLDVLLPRREGDAGPTILEINTAPMISMHHSPWRGKPRDVAGALLDPMFSVLARPHSDTGTRETPMSSEGASA